MSYRSSHTHCQAAQAQAQTKACQRVCLPQPRGNFKIFLPLFKEKIKTRQHTTNPDKKGINESIDKFNMRAQFDTNTRTDKNRQCITTCIKHLAISGISSGTARIKSNCNLTENRFEMPNVSYTQPLSPSV